MHAKSVIISGTPFTALISRIPFSTLIIDFLLRLSYNLIGIFVMCATGSCNFRAHFYCLYAYPIQMICQIRQVCDRIVLVILGCTINPIQ
jgi:hypothetical protein